MKIGQSSISKDGNKPHQSAHPSVATGSENSVHPIPFSQSGLSLWFGSLVTAVYHHTKALSDHRERKRGPGCAKSLSGQATHLQFERSATEDQAKLSRNATGNASLAIDESGKVVLHNHPGVDWRCYADDQAWFGP